MKNNMALYGYVTVAKLVFSEFEGKIKERIFQTDRKIEKIPYESCNIVIEEDDSIKSVIINNRKYSIIEKIFDADSNNEGYIIDYEIRKDYIKLDEDAENKLCETEKIVNDLHKQFPLLQRKDFSKIGTHLSGYKGEIMNEIVFGIHYEDYLKSQNIKNGIIEYLEKIDTQNIEVLNKIKHIHELLCAMSLSEKTIDTYINIVTQLFLKKANSSAEWKEDLGSKRILNSVVKYINAVFADTPIKTDWSFFNISELVYFRKK